MPKLSCIMLLLMIGLAACEAGVDRSFSPIENEVHIRGTVSPFKNPVAMSGSSVYTPDLSPPEPGEVLRAIYKEAGDGSSSYEIDNQVWASYWYGHTYQIKGRQYFTGFAYSTKETSDGDSATAAPADQVEISQATYALSPEGAVTVWEFVGAKRDVGRFGGRERANSIEEGQSPVTYLMSNGDYLIAVPTWYLETGVRMTSSEVFLLSLVQNRWRYLGNIATGEDNSASCDDVTPKGEGLPPCAVSTGSLEFYLRPGQAMPSIRVTRKGKVVDSPNKTRDLGPLDSREYFYDMAVSKYAHVD